jgi:hypothetical protein
VFGDLYVGISGPGFSYYVTPGWGLTGSRTPFMAGFQLGSSIPSYFDVTVPTCIPQGGYNINAVIVPPGESDIFNPIKQISNLAEAGFTQTTPRPDKSSISTSLNGTSFQANSTIRWSYNVTSCPHTGEQVDLYVGIVGPVSRYINSNGEAVPNETPYKDNITLGDMNGCVNFSFDCYVPAGDYTIKAVITGSSRSNILNNPSYWLSNMATRGFHHSRNYCLEHPQITVHATGTTGGLRISYDVDTSYIANRNQGNYQIRVRVDGQSVYYLDASCIPQTYPVYYRTGVVLTDCTNAFFLEIPKGNLCPGTHGYEVQACFVETANGNYSVDSNITSSITITR